MNTMTFGVTREDAITSEPCRRAVRSIRQLFSRDVRAMEDATINAVTCRSALETVTRVTCGESSASAESRQRTDAFSRA